MLNFSMLKTLDPHANILSPFTMSMSGKIDPLI